MAGYVLTATAVDHYQRRDPGDLGRGRQLALRLCINSAGLKRWERRRCAHRGGRAPRWCSGSYRPTVGHGIAHLLGQGLGELRVGLSAEGVVNGGERQP